MQKSSDDDNDDDDGYSVRWINIEIIMLADKSHSESDRRVESFPIKSEKKD